MLELIVTVCGAVISTLGVTIVCDVVCQVLGKTPSSTASMSRENPSNPETGPQRRSSRVHSSEFRAWGRTTKQYNDCQNVNMGENTDMLASLASRSIERQSERAALFLRAGYIIVRDVFADSDICDALHDAERLFRMHDLIKS